MLGIIVPLSLLLFVTTRQLRGHQAELRSQASSLFDLNGERAAQAEHIAALTAQLASKSAEYDALFAEDQTALNRSLRQEITDIQRVLRESIPVYEDILDLTQSGVNTSKLTDGYARVLTELSQRRWATASATLRKVAADTTALRTSLAAAPPLSAPSNNTAPSSGYQRQKVTTSDGEFVVDIVAGDLGSTRVIVDTASESTCTNDCPVLSVAAYAARNGAYAAINGSYFCPASYPSCSGKTNSFDTLLMNKNKVYFNADNNVYSSVPAAIFGSGYARFVRASSEWGRDTGIDGMIANQPLMVHDGNLLFSGGDDPKQSARGNRSFVGSKDSTVYIGVVRNASVAQAARVLHTMGLKNALNLDSGGSTALWVGGYKAGPGRDVPNAVLFVRK